MTLDKYVDSLGARCLDGSPPAFYIREGAEKESFIIDFCGGGWCYDESSCLARSGDALLGSSKFVTHDGNKQGLANGGLLSPDPTINPDFANWTHVL